jgi:hypothetical protein
VKIHSTDREKIPAKKSTYAHAQDFAMSDDLLLNPESIFSTASEQTTDNKH